MLGQSQTKASVASSDQDWPVPHLQLQTRLENTESEGEREEEWEPPDSGATDDAANIADDQRDDDTETQSLLTIKIQAQFEVHHQEFSNQQKIIQLLEKLKNVGVFIVAMSTQDKNVKCRMLLFTIIRLEFLKDDFWKCSYVSKSLLTLSLD